MCFRLERSLTQSLRQQQDEAYEVSLRADQEKERLKQLEREKIIQQQLDEEAERNAEVQRKEVNIEILKCFWSAVAPIFTISYICLFLFDETQTGYRSSKSGNGIADLTPTRRKPS